MRQIGNKTGTIGQPLPGIAAKVVDPDTFAPLPQGQAGMLMVYGGNVMVGYLGRPEATREVIRDGWYVTGDQSKIDEDGFITITDRLSRFSKIGGEMVPHGRIEEELQQILGTTDRMFVVTSVPDEKKGERLIVLYTPLNGTDVPGLWKKLNERGLPNLWVPGVRDFYEIDQIPVLGSGKVDLRQCKDLALQRAKD
jgi:acyl-[acyl-carrier-protein]-phospholipid O-acyltransferase/long-chain-fatty-acid--[acyl-carrier-protein] ligase